MEGKNKITIINFDASYEAPKMKYNKGKGMIEWGDKNLYPQYLLDVYNYKGSATHKSIVNKKTKLIAGKGFEDVVSPELSAFIKKNKLNKEVKKAALDYEIFNAFAFEVIWNREGTAIASLKHIPVHKLRLGIQDEEIGYPHFWFSNNWAEARKEMYSPEIIREFNPFIKQGKQVYFYGEYNPASDGLYPIIGYSTSMNWIEMDYEISKFHLNQVKQGYAPSMILNFATGIPTEEEQEMFAKEFKRNFAGSENSGKIVITYSEGTEEAPTLTPISLNDSDDRFVMLMDQIENNIVRGAEIPPQLVVLTPGKLGSTDERMELLSEFNVSYVEPRQENIEEVLNEILSIGGFKEDVKLKSAIEEQEVKQEITNEDGK